jgi:aryl-alcohol dehydrogenase-like predicted oxidoreductase
VNYWDTSEDYGTQQHIAEALRKLPRDQVVISSKINLPGKTIDAMLEELGTSYLDILFIHDVELSDLEEARATLVALQREKAVGRIWASGISTHDSGAAGAAADWPEVEVLMLPFNPSGYFLPESSIKDGLKNMLLAAEKTSILGKGIVAMKVMGWGTLAHDPEAAISFVTRLDYVHSLCIGMRNVEEIIQNNDLVNMRFKRV